MCEVHIASFTAEWKLLRLCHLRCIFVLKRWPTWWKQLWTVQIDRLLVTMLYFLAPVPSSSSSSCIFRNHLWRTVGRQRKDGKHYGGDKDAYLIHDVKCEDCATCRCSKNDGIKCLNSVKRMPVSILNLYQCKDVHTLVFGFLVFSDNGCIWHTHMPVRSSWHNLKELLIDPFLLPEFKSLQPPITPPKNI